MPEIDGDFAPHVTVADLSLELAVAPHRAVPTKLPAQLIRRRVGHGYAEKVIHLRKVGTGQIKAQIEVFQLQLPEQGAAHVGMCFAGARAHVDAIRAFLVAQIERRIDTAVQLERFATIGARAIGKQWRTRILRLAASNRQFQIGLEQWLMNAQRTVRDDEISDHRRAPTGTAICFRRPEHPVPLAFLIAFQQQARAIENYIGELNMSAKQWQQRDPEFDALDSGHFVRIRPWCIAEPNVTGFDFRPQAEIDSERTIDRETTLGCSRDTALDRILEPVPVPDKDQGQYCE